MSSLLDRSLIVVTGKGGVGKTTVAGALGILAARQGTRTVVVEVGDHSRLADLYGVRAASPGAEVRLGERLYATSVDPDRVLLEWVQELGGRIPGRILASSGTFQYFAAAAPGAKELFAMVKVWELAQDRRWQRRASGYELVILDAPATGHALGMLRSPATFGAIARVGPVRKQADDVRALLTDERRSAFVGVALATDMAVTETLELRDGLEEVLARQLDCVIVNSLLPRRFSAPEIERIAALDGTRAALAPSGRGARRAGREGELMRAAAHAAISIHERASFQHGQVARLRRRGLDVIGVPFQWAPALDVACLEAIADQIGRRIGGGVTSPTGRAAPRRRASRA
jgi:anion-transporting  ArsA/GET3 family ATPase